MFDCCDMIIWTPERILECVEDDAGEPVDCFMSAIPEGPYRDLMVKAMWERYRFAPIDSLNVDRWMQQLKDRAGYVNRKWAKIMEAYDSNNVADMSMGYTDVYDIHDTATSTGSDKFITETEDLPQSADPTGQWLTGRSTSTTTPGTTDKSDRTGTLEHKTQDMLMAEEFATLMDKMRDPLHGYTSEFVDLFANRW